MEIKEQIAREIQKIFTTLSKQKKYNRGAYGNLRTNYDEKSGLYHNIVDATLSYDEEIDNFQIIIVVNKEQTKIINSYSIAIE